jgi:hypothetical protein
MLVVWNDYFDNSLDQVMDVDKMLIQEYVLDEVLEDVD